MRIRTLLAAPLLPICYLLASCNPEPTSQAAPSTQDVQELKKQADLLKKQVEQLQQSTRSLLTRMASVEVTQNQANAKNASAIFDPTESGFQRIDSNLGTFVVSVQDVRQFADGVKVTVRLGNLSNTTFNGANLSIKYGPREPSSDDEKFVEKMETWEKAIQTKEEHIVRDLRPGFWNPVQIILPKIAQSDFGYMEVTIENSALSLY
jgi:hypothetical protein